MVDGPKVLRVGTLTAIGTLDPQRAHDFTGHVVISQVFESPFAMVDGVAEPRLIEGMPIVVDAQTFALLVRRDLRFSDGSPLTAERVAASIRPALAAYGIDVSTAGERVLLRAGTWQHRPEDLLTSIATRVVARAGRALLGTGPFAVAEADARGIRLVRNQHARRSARLDEIQVRWYERADGRADALVAALEAGEVDFSMSLARDDVASLQRVRKLFQPGMSSAFLAINTQRPPLDSAAVRRGIALAIDRYRLAELCYSNPAAFVARCLLPPALGRGSDGIRHDPAGAKAALAGTRWPKRLHMVCVWGPRPYLSRPDVVAGAVTQQLRAVGIDVETTMASNSEHYGSLLAGGDYDLVLGGWVADTPDPIDYLEAVLGSRAVVGAGSVPVAASNYAQWSDVEVDQLLVDARSGGAHRAIDGILARVASEVPLVPLMHGPRVIVHAWRVKNYDADAGVFPDFATLDLGE